MGIAVGQEVVIEGRFTRERTAEEPATPKRIPANVTDLAVWVQTPDGAEQELTLDALQLPDPETGAEDGYYAAKWVTVVPGRHRFRFSGTLPGGGAAADEGSFFVETSFVDAVSP